MNQIFTTFSDDLLTRTNTGKQTRIKTRQYQPKEQEAHCEPGADPATLRDQASLHDDFHESKGGDWPLRPLLWEMVGPWIQCQDPAQYRINQRCAEAISDLLLDLEKQRCPICSGWGHNHRVCPTEARLVQYARVGGATASILKQLKDESKVRASRVQRGPTEQTQTKLSYAR